MNATVGGVKTTLRTSKTKRFVSTNNFMNATVGGTFKKKRVFFSFYLVLFLSLRGLSSHLCGSLLQIIFLPL